CMGSGPGTSTDGVPPRRWPLVPGRFAAVRALPHLAWFRRRKGGGVVVRTLLTVWTTFPGGSVLATVAGDCLHLGPPAYLRAVPAVVGARKGATWTRGAGTNGDTPTTNTPACSGR